MAKRQDKGITPYNLRNCAYMEEFSKQNIAWQRITQGNQFAITSPEMTILDSMAFISNINGVENWLLAYLNSSLIYLWIKLNVHEYGTTGFRLSNQYVQKIPIPKIDLKINNMISKIFKEKLDNKDKLEKIEKLIYETYHFTEDELDIISSQFH